MMQTCPHAEVLIEALPERGDRRGYQFTCERCGTNWIETVRTAYPEEVCR